MQCIALIVQVNLRALHPGIDWNLRGQIQCMQ